ncbi:MAG: aspartate carbamoyltransferase, partial [Nitrospinae bacterium]|nr:aspartate carbamoyltransferase [Nitrospinota bacterium]
IMPLRIQQERISDACFPTLREYSMYYGMNLKRYKLANKKALVMHPGPLNRGVEIMPDLADSEHSRILNQVTNGVAVRMAVLFKLATIKR